MQHTSSQPSSLTHFSYVRKTGSREIHSNGDYNPPALALRFKALMGHINKPLFIFY